MRLGTDDEVRAFNGRDGDWTCRLVTEGKKVHLIPTHMIRQQETGPDLTLLFAPIKKSRLDFIVEKACELGVSTLQPIITDYTHSQRVRGDRLKSLVIEAAEQTERIDIPEVLDDRPLMKVLSEWSEACPIYFCDEGGDAVPMANALPEANASNCGAILIGPEGGFSPREREYLRALAFVKPVTLGPRILRAETAVVSALTLWQSQVGDWRLPPYLPKN